MLRPWPASDGALVRLRLVGGVLPARSLASLAAVSRELGDGEVHLTGRANLQLRGLPLVDGRLPAYAVDALEATGLLPSRTHELVRNILASPLSGWPHPGRSGGRVDVLPVAHELDRLLRADPALAGLPGRFLFVLDDGRGDLVDRPTDLGLVALDARTAQLRVGSGWGPAVPLPEAAARLVGLAREFLRARGAGPEAPWHVSELSSPLAPAVTRDPRTLVSAPPLSYGAVPGGRHVGVPGGVLDAGLTDRLLGLARGRDLRVTPWHGVLVPGPPDGGAA